jgi:hypothetical protein
LGNSDAKNPRGSEGDDEMVGGVDTIKYSDHDIADTVKFPYLAPQNYLESRGEGPSGAPLLEPAQWILGLYNTGIMNLLDIPHFGHGKHINGCVKQLLARVHGGILWMDRPVPINVDLIATITGLPMDGEKPEKYLEDKTKENPSPMKSRKSMARREVIGESGSVTSNDPATRFATRLLGRVQINAQVQKGGSTSRSGSSCSTVHEGELDELGPLST